MPPVKTPSAQLGRVVCRVRRDPALLALVTAVVVAVICLLAWPNSGTDLAAQVARAEATRRTGGSTWWGGWYGGISLPTYSILSGQVMAVLGARLTGALAFVAASWLGGGLLRDTHRPRAGALVGVLALSANLLVGRVTFALGLVLALAALRLVQGRHLLWLAAVSGMGASLLSPLAGLFLGMFCAASFVVDRSRRRAAVWIAGATALPIALTAILFPGNGVQPVTTSSVWVPGLSLLLVALLPVPTVVRATTAIAALTVVSTTFIDSPVGSNAQRLAVIACAPLVVALVHRRQAAVLLGLGAVLVWPASDIALSVQLNQDPSSRASYYAPVIAMLPTPEGGFSGRLESIETRGHWSSTYLTGLAGSIPLARGWERQTDRANNSLFYGGPLTPESYYQWLQENAVSWVALPDAEPDWGSRREAVLVAGGLPFLQQVWSTDHWRFFRVVDAAPVAPAPATQTTLDASDVRVTMQSPGSVRIRVRWSPQLAVDGVAGCIRPDAGWTQLSVSVPGTYTLRGGFSPRKGLGEGAVCTNGYF